MELNKNQIREILESYFGIKIQTEIDYISVFRLDSGNFYYLTSFEKNGKINLSIIYEYDHKVGEFAEVLYPLDFSKPIAVSNAQNLGGAVQLVWKPCKISYSPFYPFWKVDLGNKSFYVDKDENIFEYLPDH